MATMRVLVVDDDESLLRALAEYLFQQRYAVETAANGREALSIVATNPPDVVLLDVNMPGLDGFTVLRGIRAINADVSVVMVSDGDADVPTRESGRVGAFGYLPKPFDLPRLNHLLGAAARRKDGMHLERSPILHNGWRHREEIL